MGSLGHCDLNSVGDCSSWQRVASIVPRGILCKQAQLSEPAADPSLRKRMSQEVAMAK